MTISLADQIAALRRAIETREHQMQFSQFEYGATADATALRAALATLEAQQWRPIETAPKGKPFDAWLGDADEQDIQFYCTPGTRRSPAWIWSPGRSKFVPLGGLNVPVFVQPTHWMPLLPPPEEQR